MKPVRTLTRDEFDDYYVEEVDSERARWGSRIQYLIKIDDNYYLTDYIAYTHDDGLDLDGGVDIYECEKHIVTKEVWKYKK